MIDLSPIPATGGPAFPLYSHGTQTLGLNVTGMTVRDYFAAHAVQAMLSDPNWREDMSFKDTAYAAYKQADEMLEARTA